MWTGQMRSWLICLSWIMTLQHSLQDDPDVVIYDVLSLTMDNGLCPTTIDICLHTTEIILDSDTIALACEYKEGHETEQTFVSIEIPGPPTCCSSFIAESDAELELWQNFEAPVTCGIRVHHTDPAGSGFGSIVFDNPDAFPNCDGATSWSDDKRVGVYCSERNGFTDAVLTTVADIDGSFQSEGVIYTTFTTSVDDHSSVAAICIDIPNTSIDVLDGTTVKICSKQELVITPAPVKSTPGETELIYGSNIVITLSHNMTGNSVDCFVTPDDIATGSCVIDNTALTIPIAASYTGNNKNIVIFFNIYTNGATTNWGNIQLKDCKLTTLALTPHTIELSWESAMETDFTIEATAAGRTLTEKVTCIVDSPICYGYLIGLDENTEYTCSVFVTDGLNKISKSESTPAILTVNEVIIHRLMRVAKTDDKFQENYIQVKVQVESAVDILEISLIKLIVIQLKTITVQTIIELVEENNIEANKAKELAFTIPEYVLANDQETSFLVRMSDLNGEILGYGETSVTLKDLSSTKVAKVGEIREENNTISASLRIEDCQGGLSVNNKDCSSASPSIEYYLRYVDASLDSVLVCYRNSGSPTDVLQCDQTQTLSVSQEMTNAGAILTRLLSSSITLEITNYSSTSPGEIVYYNPVPSPNEPTVEEVIKCEVESPGDNCKTNATSEAIDNMDEVFNILAVDLTADSIKSLDFPFEDYRVSVQQITIDALQVLWSARDNTIYQCDLPKNSSTAWDHDTVNCGDQEPCVIFFIQMEPTTDTLLATIRKYSTDTDLRNVVGREFKLETEVETPSRNATLRLYVSDQTTLLEVCPDQPLQTNLNYTLAVVDMLGHHLTSDSYTESCFSPLDVAALWTDKLRVMVYSNSLRQDSHQMAHVPLSTDVYLLDSSSRSAQSLHISQISGQTVRASWHNMNSMSVTYQVEAAGKTMDVICEARKDCDAYIHLDDIPKVLNISLTENNQGTMQVVNTEINLSNISG